MTAIQKLYLLTFFSGLAIMAGYCFPAETVATEGKEVGGIGHANKCLLCHEQEVDPNHNFGCVPCHHGDSMAGDRQAAHDNLLPKPAHPDHMAVTCAACHPREVKKAATSLHFSLKNEVNLVRTLFGAREPLASLRDIPVHENPATPLELADDLLRRRCLRCHVYYEGDDYPGTKHGLGCAACHMQFDNGHLRSHVMQAKPQDEQCLSCHYGNRVGADYYGRFEHDFSWEFRTPFAVADDSNREYGVEYHQLTPDIHQIRGLSCIDCHGAELHTTAEGQDEEEAAAKTTCETCHLWQPATQAPPLANLTVDKGKPLLIAKLTGRRHPLLRPQHEAHFSEAAGVACVACHAQWSFNDKGSHLLRQDTTDYEPWTRLTIQSSSEVEQVLEEDLFGTTGDAPLPHEMTDKITGASHPGLWYKGFELRRWEFVLLGRDRQGVLTVMRPVLDLHLSYLDHESNVIVDSAGDFDERQGLRPYTPHTVGKAGAYYRQRLLKKALRTMEMTTSP